jgi:hypothetical protein
VGFVNLSLVEWGPRYNPPGFPLDVIDIWHANTLAKTRGLWYSLFGDGECRPDDPTQEFCSWRLLQTVKKVGKECSDTAIDAVIKAGDRSAPWGGRCFDRCAPADRRNTSSECYILCFYRNVLGPNGSTQILNTTSPNFGIPVLELLAAWEKPFAPEAQGGCPSIPLRDEIAPAIVPPAASTPPQSGRNKQQ